MQSGSSLRTRLVVSLVAIVIGALVLAGWFGIARFDAMMEQQAQRAVDTNMAVASGTLADAVTSVAEAVKETASDRNLPDATADTARLTDELARRVGLTGITYYAVLSPEGKVTATSRGVTYDTSWDLMRTAADSQGTVVGLAIVPEDELVALSLNRPFALEPKETPNGTIVPGESDGALAIVGTTPFRDGTLVGVRVLKMRFDIVDPVVEKVGGTATIFQNGMRISTTVLDDAGQRAVGTVISDTVREATLDGGETYRGEAFVVTKRYLTAYEPLRDAAGDIIGMLYVGIEQEPYAAATRGFALTFGGAIVVAFLLALLGAFNVSRALSRPLAGLSEAAATVATGDLTTQVPALGYREAHDLGEAFNTMTGSLRSIIAQVEQSVDGLRSVSGEISSASHSAAEQATHQASSVAQTTATLEELTASFQAVADGARRVLDLAEDSLESAQGGVSTVDRAHAAMDELAVGSQSMADAAAAMTTVAEDITEMTGLITGISEQTKILALNAAIEAARAGEAGKGFAVVSSEIRTLADSVGHSAGRIHELVSGIQVASGRLQEAAAHQALLTEGTVSASHESRQAFGSIVHQMEDTAFAAREIAEATTQQKRASEQLVEAMHQVSVSTTETAAAARQLARSADVVEEEAETLTSALTRFRTR